MPAMTTLLALLAATALAETAPEADLSAETRAEYLAGEPVLVRITAENSASEDVAMPDLASRPWVVKFKVEGPAGTKTWSTSAPETDPGGRWTLKPRSQRQVLLEIPSSESLPPADYTVTIEIDDDGKSRTLPSWSMRVSPPAPSYGRVDFDAQNVESVGFQTAWVHKALDGYDLYLHHADAAAPTETLGDYHLHHAAEPIEPILSLSRPQESWDRYVYWQSGEKGIELARLQGQTLRGELRRVEAPYPSVEVIGRGSTDANGGLHVPLWIPAPSGAGGEIRVASIKDRATRFRSVGHYRKRPELVESVVDSAGDLRVLVLGDDLVLHHVSQVGELPSAGKLVLKGDQAKWVRGAEFGSLPTRDGESGGLALFLLSEALQENPDETTTPVFQGRWYSLGGRELHAFPLVERPEGWSPVDTLTRGYDPFVLLLKKDGAKKLLQVSPNSARQAPAWVPEPALAADSDGGVWLRGVGAGGPVLETRLKVAP